MVSRNSHLEVVGWQWLVLVGCIKPHVLWDTGYFLLKKVTTMGSVSVWRKKAYLP